MERSIEASTGLRAAFTRARAVLIDDPGSVLCDSCSADDRRTRRFRTVLCASLRGGAAVGHAIELQLGIPTPGAGAGLAIPITWRATGHDRLFPTFVGELVAMPHRSGTLVRVLGTYTVPLGPVGRFGDGVAGRQLARRSLGAFVTDVARRLDTQIDRSLHVVPADATHIVAVVPADATHTVAVNDHVGSENFVG